MRLDEILLTEDQERLLAMLIEARDGLPPERQRDFMYRPSIARRTSGPSREDINAIFTRGESTLIEGRQYLKASDVPPEYDQDTIVHEGLPGGVIQVTQIAIDAFVEQGLIRFRNDDKTQKPFFITPFGDAYHQQLLKPTGESVAPERCALILKGGGVKGLALVGALLEIEKYYSFSAYVGTSAGAIVAGLLAAECSASDLEKILRETNFKRFQDARWYQKLSNLILHLYLHPGKEFEKWLFEQVRTFNEKHWRMQPPTLKDLKTRLTIYATQEGKGALIFDSQNEDENRNSELTFAIRCSMSIPGFFKAPLHNGRPVYDGGLLNNFPARDWIARNPHSEFLGIYLGEKVLNPAGSALMPAQVANIVINQDDAQFIDAHRERVIVVDPNPVGTTDFDLSSAETDFLVLQGRADALAHLHRFLPADRRPAEAEVLARRAEADSARLAAIAVRKSRRRWNWIRRGAIIALLIALLVAVAYQFGTPLLKLSTGHYYDWLYDRATAYQQRNDKASIEKEIALYDRLVTAEYKLVSVLDNRGDARERLAALEQCKQNMNRAIDDYQSAINTGLTVAEPDDVRSSIGAVYLNLGLARAKVGQVDEARKDLQRVLERKALGDKGVTDEKYETAKRILQMLERGANTLAIPNCN